MTDNPRIVSIKPRYIDTPKGPRSFTDISIEIEAQTYGARMHGAFSTADAQAYLAATQRRILQN